ncbi:hypothetical protein [Chondrinema litorale]|uniref:hypothetical protein n=1 Tax=Chondrinema litorale TaxID=2994555 RepID=UPI002542BFA3|nr:hypothetical protein [Chondrinema litorale]UZR99189.1 hypothetical protein OQ292_35570 [Chondrinema litorale]
MKLSIIVSLMSLIYFSAIGQTTQQVNAQYGNYGAYNSQNYSNGNNNLVTLTRNSPKTGQPMEYWQVPTDWKMTPQGFEAPGVTIRNYPMRIFTEMQRNLTSVDQAIQEDIYPYLQQQGAKVVNVFDAPEITNCDRKIKSMYWQWGQTQDQMATRVIEIKEANGNPGLIVIHYIASYSGYGSTFFYYLNGMEATPAAYEKAKKDYLYALATMQVNQQYVAQSNQQNQNQSQASWNAHNARMSQNQKNFEAHNQYMQQTNNEINQIINDGYNTRNQISDNMHQNTINTIREEQTMYDPYSGTNINVQSGYKYYYINSFGQYFGTNDEFYKPNADPNINNVEWKPLKQN